MTSPARLSVRDFATWEPMFRLLRKANAAALDAPGGHVSGYVSPRWYSVPFRWPPDPRQLGRALQVSDMQEENDAMQRVRASLAEAGMGGVSFKAEISARGHATLWLFTPPPTMEPGIGFAGAYPGTLVRYEGALPEPARRLPEPNPGARPHPSADPALLERVLRQRLPATAGATEEDLAAAEARLGMPLPGELKAQYRTMRAPVEPREDDQDWDEDDDEPGEWLTDAMLGELLHSLDGVHIADAATRFPSWHLAREAVITPPEAAVQQLVGSPGWIVFGDDRGDNRYAIDMTPGPSGNLGQVVALPVHQDIGARLKARSLTDFVQGRFAEDPSRPGEAPVIADVYQGGQQAIEAIAHPDLEVLAIRKGPRWEGEPLGLAPLAGLPKLRTLCADPGTLADPLQITELAALEYLELGPRDWRALLDARAVPDSLMAAEIAVWANPAPRPQPDPAGYVTLANEIIALWNGPQITTTVIDGQLE